MSRSHSSSSLHKFEAGQFKGTGRAKQRRLTSQGRPRRYRIVFPCIWCRSFQVEDRDGQAITRTEARGRPPRRLARIGRLRVLSVCGIHKGQACVLKEKDVKLDGNLCSMPRTPAFELGIVAISCLFASQVIGTSAWSSLPCSREKQKKKATEDDNWKSIVPIVLLIFSWATFGLVLILLGPASSMNKGQTYGSGWLEGKCYTVKRGIYGGAALMNLVSMFCVLGLVFITRRADPSTPPDKQTQKPHESKIEAAGEACVAEA